MATPAKAPHPAVKHKTNVIIAPAIAPEVDTARTKRANTAKATVIVSTSQTGLVIPPEFPTNP